MDKMVVEADCIPGGIDGEAPDRKQVLDKREIQGDRVEVSITETYPAAVISLVR